MTHPQKTLAVEVPASDVAVLGVVVTGLVAMVCPTGWQVTWLVVLAVAVWLYRHGGRLGASLGPSRVPQGPDGG